MPYNSSEKSIHENKGDETLHRRRKSRSPNRIYPRRPSIDRNITQQEPAQPNITYPNDQPFDGDKNTDYYFFSSEYRSYLDLYYWMLVRIGAFLFFSFVLPIHISFSIAFALIIIYFDIYLPLTYSRRISKRSLFVSIIVLVAVLTIKFSELQHINNNNNSNTLKTSSTILQEPQENVYLRQQQQLEERIRQHSSSLINRQINLLENKLNSLKSEMNIDQFNDDQSFQISEDYIRELIRQDLSQVSHQLTPQQLTQVQTLITTYLQQQQKLQSSQQDQQFDSRTIENTIKKVVSDVTREFKLEIESLKQSLSKISLDVLRTVIRQWVEDEVKRVRLLESGSSINLNVDHLNKQAQNLEFSPQQTKFIHTVISESLHQYSSLYNRLICPHASITTISGRLYSPPTELTGSQHFGTWKAPIGGVVELQVSLTQRIHPFLIVISSSYKSVSKGEEPSFICPPSKFELYCKNQILVSGVFNTSEPFPSQDFSLNTKTPNDPYCDVFRLVVSPSSIEHCHKEDQTTLVQFKHLIYGFPSESN